MPQVSIGSYIENNSVDVTSSTAKLVGMGTVFVGDLPGGAGNAGGIAAADVSRARSEGVFVGIDGRKM